MTMQTNTNTNAAKMIQMMECPKCGGKGHFPEFAGIYNGTCFKCNGSGKVSYRASKANTAELSNYQIQLIETVKTADFSTMTFGQLSEIRNAAHYPIRQCPELLNIWRERGDSFFFAAQEQKLAGMYSSR